MAAATLLLALVAATAGFFLSYFAAEFGLLLSFAIAYLAGTIVAACVVLASTYLTIQLKQRQNGPEGINSATRRPRS